MKLTEQGMPKQVDLSVEGFMELLQDGAKASVSNSLAAELNKANRDITFSRPPESSIMPALP